MPQENVEIVRRVFLMVQESLRRGDPGSSFDEWVREGLIAPASNGRRARRAGMGVAGIDDFAGRDGYMEFTRRWTEDFEEFALEPEQIVGADDDRVVVTAHTRGAGQGKRCDRRHAHRLGRHPRSGSHRERRPLPGARTMHSKPWDCEIAYHAEVRQARV